MDPDLWIHIFLRIQQIQILSAAYDYLSRVLGPPLLLLLFNFSFTLPFDLIEIPVFKYITLQNLKSFMKHPPVLLKTFSLGVLDYLDIMRYLKPLIN